MGTLPSFSKVSVTSHMPSGPRESEPEKMTSSIGLPRRCLADCSPMPQRIAATMFDLPQPFGPTTAVIGSLNDKTVLSQNDLNPTTSSRLIRIPLRAFVRKPSQSHRATYRHNWAPLSGEISAVKALVRGPAPARAIGKFLAADVF